MTERATYPDRATLLEEVRALRAVLAERDRELRELRWRLREGERPETARVVELRRGE